MEKQMGWDSGVKLGFWFRRGANSRARAHSRGVLQSFDVTFTDFGSVCACVQVFECTKG